MHTKIILIANMKRFSPVIFALCMAACMPNYITKSYNGAAWQTQSIPGKIECELYDNGGESVAYHDTDGINNGSGKLNPANGNYLNEFRMKEGVDISYTKSNNIDNNPFNQHEPVLNQLYVGWTKPGEWINYTIKVKETTLYRVALMYTANGDGTIAIDVDGKRVATSLKIPSTHNDADTVACDCFFEKEMMKNLLAKGIERYRMYRFNILLGPSLVISLPYLLPVLTKFIKFYLVISQSPPFVELLP